MLLSLNLSSGMLDLKESRNKQVLNVKEASVQVIRGGW